MKKITFLILSMVLIILECDNLHSQDKRNLANPLAKEEGLRNLPASDAKSILDLPFGVGMRQLKELLPQYGCKLINDAPNAISASSNDIFGSPVSFVGLFPGDNPTKYAICFISLQKNGEILFPMVNAWVQAQNGGKEICNPIIKSGTWEWITEDLLVYMYNSREKRAAITIANPQLTSKFNK